MADLCPNPSTIILNISGLNTPIKRQRLAVNICTKQKNRKMREGKTDKTENINRQIQIIVGDFNTPSQ